MPFVSEKQKKWMYANKPKMAKKWSKKYGNKIKSNEKMREKVLKARAS